MNQDLITSYFNQIKFPTTLSHKGDNGKALIIGGSDLFHSASFWSFEVISRLVDMTFYSSVQENNEIIKNLKTDLIDGVVVSRSNLPDYLEEVSAVLIGPGMRRDVRTRFSQPELQSLTLTDLNNLDWEEDTAAVTAALLRSYPHKNWVIDAGALQVLDPQWLPSETILTPHAKEFSDLLAKIDGIDRVATISAWEAMQQEITKSYFKNQESMAPQVVSGEELSNLTQDLFDWSSLLRISEQLNQALMIIKGPADLIVGQEQVLAVVGGNAGLTKGGSGDALAGMITGLVANYEKFPSVVVASYMNKLAGHNLWQRQAMMFNTSDLVAQLPLSFKEASIFLS